MDFVLFEDPKLAARNNAFAAAAAALPGMGAVPAMPSAANGFPVQPMGAGPGAAFGTMPGMAPAPGTSFAGVDPAKSQVPLAFSAGAFAGNHQSQPLALGGFNNYRTPVDPMANPTPQQLASLVASQHAADASQFNGASTNSNISFPGIPSTPTVGAALAEQVHRIAQAEQTSPFMGAHTPLPLGGDVDAMPLFPSSSSMTTPGQHARQSSLNSTCSSAAPGAGEVNNMDIFNGSPVNPPSGSFGPPIHNLSLGTGSSNPPSGSMRSDSVDSFTDPPLFPQSSLASSATTPSETGMQATGSRSSMDGAKASSNMQLDVTTPTAGVLPFATTSAAANSLFSMAAQQQAQNQAAAAGSSLTKEQEGDLLTTPKARERPMPVTTWSSLFGPKAAAALGEAPSIGGRIGTGTVGPTSGAPDMGTPSSILPLSLGGGFFNPAAPAGQPTAQNAGPQLNALDTAAASSAKLTSEPAAAANAGENKRAFLRGPSAANASPGNSASSGLSLFDASESSTLEEDDDEGSAETSPNEGVQSTKVPNTLLQIIGRNLDKASSAMATPTGGESLSRTPTATGISGSGTLKRQQQPTQLSMLASSSLFNSSDGHDAPRFATIDTPGTSESEDERELEESIRRRRKEQHLLRQRGMLLDPLVHGPDLSASSSSLNIPGGSSDGGHASTTSSSGEAPLPPPPRPIPPRLVGNNYLGTHPGMSRRSSSSTSEEDTLMSPPIRDSAEAVHHFGAGAAAAAAGGPSSAVQQRNFRSQMPVGGGAGKGKTGGPGHAPGRSVAQTKSNARHDDENDEDAEADGDDDFEDDEPEEDDDDDEGEDEDEDYAETAEGGGSGKPRGGGASRGRNSRNSRVAGSGAALTGSGAAPAQKRRKRLSPKADEPIDVSTLGGSHTTSTGLTVCDYVSPLVMMAATDAPPTASTIKEARCGTVFHRPYDLSRHRETIHAREEARLVKAGQLKVEDCVVMGKEIAAEKVMAGATEWKCEGKNGCGSVFSRKDALLRHQRIRGHK